MTETTRKLTKIEMYEKVLTRLTNPDEIEFINHQIELLKSKSANRKPTTNQITNNMFKCDIASFLTANTEEKFSISDIQSNVPSVEKLSNQRMSALMKQLVEEGVVKKVYEKRKAYFFV